MNDSESALIIGGSRFIGPRIVEKLLGHGYAVTVFNRGNIASTYPAGVSFVRGDRARGFPFKERFDVVIDMCAYSGEDTLRAIHDLRFNFFVHMGTAAAYRKSSVFPLREDSPLGDWPVWGEYNRGKVACERALEESNMPFAAVRPVYVLGAKSHLNRERFIYRKIKSGDPLVLPGDGMALTQYVFVDEVAEVVLRLAETKMTGAINCAGDDYITLIGLAQEMAKVVGKNAVIHFNPDADGERHNHEEFPFANEHFIVANERAKGLGVRFMSLREGLRRDYEDYYRVDQE